MPGRNRAVAKLRAGRSGAVAALQDDRSITVFDPRTARAALHGRNLQRQAVKDVAWSSDGRRLACASLDGSVVLVEHDGSWRELLRAPCGVHALAWSPVAPVLALGLLDGSVELRDAAEGELHARYRDHSETIFALAFRPDGSALATAGRDGVVGLRGDGFRALRGHEDLVMSLAWSPDGRLLASGSRDATIRLWSPEGVPAALLRGHARTIWDLSFTPDATRLLSSSFDRDVRVWDVRGEGGCLSVLAGHTRQVSTVVALDDHTALSGSRDGTCRLWDLADGSAQALRLHELPGAKEIR